MGARWEQAESAFPNFWSAAGGAPEPAERVDVEPAAVLVTGAEAVAVSEAALAAVATPTWPM